MGLPTRTSLKVGTCRLLERGTSRISLSCARALVLGLSILAQLSCQSATAQPTEAILSFDSYAEVHHPVPYIVNVASSAPPGHLIYVGVAHVTDARDPQLELLARLWEQARPSLAFYEGPTHPPPEDLSFAIRAGQGEAAMVRMLALRSGVNARSLDPTIEEQVVAMRSKGYHRCSVAQYFVLRQIAQHRHRVGRKQLPVDTANIIAYFNAVEGLQGCVEQHSDLESAMRGVSSRLDWRDVPHEWFDPVSENAPELMNRLSVSLNRFRDVVMVSRLCAAISAGHRVFAAAGASHVVMQEPALAACTRSQIAVQVIESTFVLSRELRVARPLARHFPPMSG